MPHNTHVVVIGGGFAGVMAANRLTQRKDVTVTLVNPRPAFVARLRLHQLVGGSHGAVIAYTDVLAKGIRLMIDSVTRIDASNRTVTLATQGTIAYDYLIYAVGSGGASAQVPGAREHAHLVHTLETAQRLRSVIKAAPLAATITVVGAGPTGLETAAELAEQGRRVSLVCGGEFAPYLHLRARRTAQNRLAKLGAQVLVGPGSKVTEVMSDAVRLADGRTLPSHVTIWTAGFGIPKLAADSGLSTDAAGRLMTDETLTSVDDARIVAAGDSAAPSDMPLRMGAYTASCLGAHAADTVLRRISGQEPEPVSVLFAAMCVSIGRRAAIFQFFRKDDTALRLRIWGGFGSKIKEMACNSSVSHLTKEARKPGSHKWLGNSLRAKTLEARRGSLLPKQNVQRVVAKPNPQLSYEQRRM
jgi:NADH:ubiquinone reductase (H+-translocating)